MALDLDTRQRAMLQEMGVHVWLPGTEFAVDATAQVASPATQVIAGRPSAAKAAPSGSRLPPLRDADLSQVAAEQGAPVRAAMPVPANALASGALVSADWPALHQAASACQACGLCAGRRNTTLLPAAGTADWMVVGDPPDDDEDATASPFAGPAGVLLDNMLAALQLRRSKRVMGTSGTTGVASPAMQAHVTNIVKCRPPSGAQVQAADLAHCAAYLDREIALVRPKMILAMGRFANQWLLGETPELANLPLGKLRGVVRQYKGIAVVPTYHPKALLRNSPDKAKAWADLCLAADALDAIRAMPSA